MAPETPTAEAVPPRTNTLGVIEVVEPRVAEIWRRMTPLEKMALIDGGYRLARQCVRGGVMYDHPEWTEQQVEGEVSRRISRGADWPATHRG
ncbi:hypothetical protein Pla175_09640 [Pirellulimonas nuda]|uniref:Uncharacterized protein n=1 Tax=Pirellulimonas nuda TaxID=2528009 RepID=A0A518D7Z1_9BACT|nr:hypothetical protein [Pirellulimonas nuda]QDU87599.1 hypothetical protein Pla175_09640 [Pirellulimonas nuda]